MAININNQQSDHIDNHDNFNGNGSDMDQGYCHQQHHHRVSSSPLTIRKKLMTQSTHEIPTTTTKTTITTMISFF